MSIFVICDEHTDLKYYEMRDIWTQIVRESEKCPKQRFRKRSGSVSAYAGFERY